MGHMWKNIDYSECNDLMSAAEYIRLLKLSNAMKDVLKAFHNAKNSEDLGEDVIEIIEGWRLEGVFNDDKN